MGYLILPVLVIVFVPLGPCPDQLEDFSRFSRAIGQQVALVDHGGVFREGIVDAATAESVTLRVGSIKTSFPRAGVARADRTKKDSSIDGALKGALIGFALTALASQGCDSTIPRCPSWIPFTAITAAGYVIDASVAKPRPLYRAPSSSPSPTLSVSLRF